MLMNKKTLRQIIGLYLSLSLFRETSLQLINFSRLEYPLYRGSVFIGFDAIVSCHTIRVIRRATRYNLLRAYGFPNSVRQVL